MFGAPQMPFYGKKILLHLNNAFLLSVQLKQADGLWHHPIPMTGVSNKFPTTTTLYISKLNKAQIYKLYRNQVKNVHFRGTSMTIYYFFQLGQEHTCPRTKIKSWRHYPSAFFRHTDNRNALFKRNINFLAMKRHLGGTKHNSNRLLYHRDYSTLSGPSAKFFNCLLKAK